MTNLSTLPFEFDHNLFQNVLELTTIHLKRVFHCVEYHKKQSILKNSKPLFVINISHINANKLGIPHPSHPYRTFCLLSNNNRLSFLQRHQSLAHHRTRSSPLHPCQPVYAQISVQLLPTQWSYHHHHCRLPFPNSLHDHLEKRRNHPQMALWRSHDLDW